jgi:hypothetical protein
VLIRRTHNRLLGRRHNIGYRFSEPRGVTGHQVRTNAQHVTQTNRAKSVIFRWVQIEARAVYSLTGSSYWFCSQSRSTFANIAYSRRVITTYSIGRHRKNIVNILSTSRKKVMTRTMLLTLAASLREDAAGTWTTISFGRASRYGSLRTGYDSEVPVTIGICRCSRVSNVDE